MLSYFNEESQMSVWEEALTPDFSYDISQIINEGGRAMHVAHFVEDGIRHDVVLSSRLIDVLKDEKANIKSSKDMLDVLTKAGYVNLQTNMYGRMLAFNIEVWGALRDDGHERARDDEADYAWDIVCQTARTLGMENVREAPHRLYKNIHVDENTNAVTLEAFEKRTEPAVVAQPV